MHTDELQSYTQLDTTTDSLFNFAEEPAPDFIHEVVNHQAEEYVRGNVHTTGWRTSGR